MMSNNGNSLNYSDEHRIQGKLWYPKTNRRSWLVWFMVLNITFNNISAISWWSVLSVEEPEVPGENHRPVACH